MSNKLVSYILTTLFVLTFCSFASAQDKSVSKEELMWSRVKRSDVHTAEKTVSIPVKQSTEIRSYKLANGVATVFPNKAVHPSEASTQSELSIITHPTNPNIVLGGSNAAEITSINWLSQGWYVSTNGGNSWTGSDTLPPHLPQFSLYTSDPAVGIDLNGNMYFNTLLYGTGAGDVVTTKSTNNGASWSSFSAVPNATTGEDKNHFTVDVNPNSPYVGNLYTSYTEFDVSPNRLNFSRSTNGGTSFTAPMVISNGGSVDQGVNLAVGPDGEVYGVWTSYVSFPSNSNVGFNKSTDGGATWGTQTSIFTGVADIRGNLIKGGNSVRVSSFPSLAVDRSMGSRRGWLYAAWPAKPNGNPDIFLSRSTDGGATWSDPSQVNQDETNRDQWESWITCDPATGAVYIMYYDSRNFAANDSAQVYLARSLDGGDTFEEVLVSDHAFLPKAITGLAGGYMGDYISVIANNGIVYCFWNDNRSGHHLAYVAKAIFGPSIVHEPLGNTENMAGPYAVSANVSSSGAPLNASSVKVFWTRGTTFNDSAAMTLTTGDEFVGNIPGNGQPADYRYYIQAIDSLGGISKDPAGAPGEYYMFSAATDTIPPVIMHEQIDDQYLENWPAVVVAEVTDNIGVDSVWVNWMVNDTSGSFVLEMNDDGVYEGEFNVDEVLLEVGDVFNYSIYAKDAGAAGNVASLPEVGNFSFTFIEDTVNPMIETMPLRDQPRVRWPATVKATVTDELGIDEVVVEWYKNDPSNDSEFELTNDDNDLYSGMFDSDSSMVAVGDSIFYRIRATDDSYNGNVTYWPEEGYKKFNIIATKGFVLVVSDDDMQNKRSYPKGIRFSPDTLSSGGSSELFATTLTDLGYIVETQTVPDVDTTTWDEYDILVWAHGLSSGPASNADWIHAMSSRVQRGLSVIVEGGDIGWQFMSSSPDVDFSTNVLHCYDFINEAATLGNPTLHDESHPLSNTPNELPASYELLSGVSVYNRDNNEPMPDAVPVFTWAGDDTGSSVVAWDDTPNPIRGRVVYITFNINNVVPSQEQDVKNLIENAADWLIGSEPLPTGSLSGMVTLQGAPNNSGASVHIKGPGINETIETPENGEFAFDNLYPGMYKVNAWKQGYYSANDTLEIEVAGGPSLGNNFTFAPTGPVGGKVTLQGAPNNSGASVHIVGPGIDEQIETDSTGVYDFSMLNSGMHRIYAWKEGFFPYIDSADVEVTMDSSMNNNFTFAAILPGNVFGTVTLNDTNNYGGISVTILEQNLSTVSATNGSYIITQVMPGDLHIRYSKDGYRKLDTMVTMPNGGNLTINCQLSATSGLILLVDDDNLGETNSRIKERTGLAIDTIDNGGSAMLFKRSLEELGYDVEYYLLADIPDTSLWSNYDVIVWSHGRSGGPMDQVQWRRRMSEFVLSGGKVIIEGGDIGWQFMSSTPDVDFATNVLHCDDFVSEAATIANPTVNAFDHPIVSTPNQLPENFPMESVSGVYDRDGNLSSPDATAVYSWSGDASLSSIVAWQESDDASSPRTVYFSFNINNVMKEDSMFVKYLIENSMQWLYTGGTTGIPSNIGTRIPTTFSLEQNYPNPFNPTTNLRFGLPTEANVTLRIYNVLGQEVAVLVNGVQSAGYHQAVWNAASTVSSGVYFYRIAAVPTNGAEPFTKICKMMLMK